MQLTLPYSTYCIYSGREECCLPDDSFITKCSAKTHASILPRMLNLSQEYKCSIHISTGVKLIFKKKERKKQ